MLLIFMLLVFTILMWRLYYASEDGPIFRDIIGARTIKQNIKVRPKFPNLAVPFRNPTTMWKAPVPLTPFKAPLVEPESYEGKVYDFLLYKPEFLGKVINQGSCGACWAFMVCEVLTDRLMIMTGGRFRKNLSVQELMACYNPDGCDGDSPELAMLWLAQTGTKLHLNDKVPYKQKGGGVITTKCSSRGIVGVEPDSTRSIVKFIPEEKFDQDTLEQNIINMKIELLVRGPFYCAMTVYEDFIKFDGTEVYSRDSSFIVGGHAVEIIGYCNAGVDPRPGFEKAYWICKSSWGDNWPLKSEMDGFFTIEMGKNMCGIESRAGFATPELFANVNLDNLTDISKLRYTNINKYLYEL